MRAGSRISIEQLTELPECGCNILRALTAQFSICVAVPTAAYKKPITIEAEIKDPVTRRWLRRRRQAEHEPPAPDTAVPITIKMHFARFSAWLPADGQRYCRTAPRPCGADAQELAGADLQTARRSHTIFGFRARLAGVDPIAYLADVRCAASASSIRPRAACALGRRTCDSERRVAPATISRARSSGRSRCGRPDTTRVVTLAPWPRHHGRPGARLRHEARGWLRARRPPRAETSATSSLEGPRRRLMRRTCVRDQAVPWES